MRKIPVPTFGARRLWNMGAIGLVGAGLLLCYGVVGTGNPSDPHNAAAQQQEQEVKTNADLIPWQAATLPGAIKVGDGLKISPTSLSIVEQNGSGGQPNPPLNLSSYIETKGEYTIEATATDFKDSDATISLYGQVPVIADEFRIERPRVRLGLDDGHLSVTMWDGKQEPISTQTFTFTSAATVTIATTIKDDKLSFAVNGRTVGEVKAPGIFKDKLWFGATAEKSDWTLASLQIKELNENKTSLKVVDVSSKTMTVHDDKGLQALAAKKRPGFMVGAAISPGTIVDDPAYAAIALDKSQLGTWTPENAMKMQFLQPKEGQYYFQYADLLVKLAQQNGIAVHGHALVFGEANPRWFNDLPVNTSEEKQHIEKIMEEHITKVVTHFGDKINSWDVVNEPMADYDEGDGSGTALRNHKWYKAMGESYIAKALVAAHKANPQATLFINEWGLEEDGERWDAFLARMTALKATLAAQGVPADKIGVGFQAHVYDTADRINPATLTAHLKQLGELGFKAQISEMDVTSELGDDGQGQQYAEVFQACLNEPTCIGWRTWILSDRYNFWKDDDGSIQQGTDGLFSTDMKPRPGYVYIQKLLN